MHSPPQSPAPQRRVLSNHHAMEIVGGKDSMKRKEGHLERVKNEQKRRRSENGLPVPCAWQLLSDTAGLEDHESPLTVLLRRQAQQDLALVDLIATEEDEEEEEKKKIHSPSHYDKVLFDAIDAPTPLPMIRRCLRRKGSGHREEGNLTHFSPTGPMLFADDYIQHIVERERLGRSQSSSSTVVGQRRRRREGIGPEGGTGEDGEDAADEDEDDTCTSLASGGPASSYSFPSYSSSSTSTTSLSAKRQRRQALHNSPNGGDNDCGVGCDEDDNTHDDSIVIIDPAMEAGGCDGPRPFSSSSSLFESSSPSLLFLSLAVAVISVVGLVHPVQHGWLIHLVRL